jgi:antitoxin MazE
METPKPVPARLVRIGNSRGVRIPKPLLEQAGLAEDVELRVVADGILIASASSARRGWADAARDARARGDDALLDTPSATRFDEREWEWR